MELSFKLRQKIVEFLTSLPAIHDKKWREVLIFNAGLDELKGRIRFDGESVVFVPSLIDLLTDHGKLKDGRDALEALLEAIKELGGLDRTETCNNFIQQLRTLQSKYSFTEAALEKLPEKPLNLPEFDSTKELEEKFEELKKERILLISCLDEKTLLSAAYAIVEKFDEKSYQRGMFLDKGDSDSFDLDLGVFTNQTINDQESLIVVINVKSQIFLDSMRSDILSAQHIKGVLTARGIMLICLVKEVLDQKPSDFHFAYWKINFLHHLLKQYFSESESESEPTAQDLEGKINKQREQGLWGEVDNDGEFYELIYGYLQSGIKQFQEEVKKRENVRNDQEIDKPEELKRLKELIKDEKDGMYIEKTVLYVATFFPELNFEDFNQIVSLLLKDKKITEVQPQTADETGEKEIVKIEKELIEIWQNRADRILENCCLKPSTSENFPQAIDFQLPYLRIELKKFLEQQNPYYLRQEFKCIQESGLLFDLDISPKVIEDVIHLSAEMSAFVSESHVKKWLATIVTEFKRGTEDDKEEKIKRIIFVRFSNLIREMLNYLHLQETVNKFLEDLINTRHHDVVLEIAKRLRFAPRFDSLYWIQQLLERGNEEEMHTKTKAYTSLLGLARQSGFRIYELLEKIKMWLPATDCDPGTYSQSNRYALKFIIEYCSQLKIALEHYNEWYSNYPLFGALQKNDDLTETKLNVLTSWILHPGIKYVYGDANIIIADLIEEWFIILHGFKKDIFPEALEMSELLIQQIILTANRFQRKELLNRWRSKQRIYLKEIGKLDHAQRAQREQLKHKRELVKELVECFKQFRQQAT